jgi:hypothetical protein
VLAVISICLAPAFAADTEVTVGKAGCKVVNAHPAQKAKGRWNGPCKDGYADGVGTLEWFIDDEPEWRFEGNLRRGRLHGDGVLHYEYGSEYKGSFADNQRNGMGIEQLAAQIRYEGEWKNGEREGWGVRTWSDGSRYEGQWRAGKFHGAGKATYTSGKVVEGQFSDGTPAGEAALVTDAPGKGYTMDTEPNRSHLPRGTPTLAGPVSFRKSWDGMSQADQRVVRGFYGLMHEDDEPPYPANGTARIYTALAEAQKAGHARGLLRMNVMVDASGAATAVTVYVTPAPYITRIASALVMKEKYKPALCAGIPCAMVYPYEVVFTAR